MNVKTAYTAAARGLASKSMTGLARTRVTPNQLTAAGVTLCATGGVIVYFEYRDDLLYYWLGALVFVVGSILDILDGALARAGGKQTPFGAFIDSTTDRASEAFMLGAVGLVFMRHEHELALGLTIAAIAGITPATVIAVCTPKRSAMAPLIGPPSAWPPSITME